MRTLRFEKVLISSGEWERLAGMIAEGGEEKSREVRVLRDVQAAAGVGSRTQQWVQVNLRRKGVASKASASIAVKEIELMSSSSRLGTETRESASSVPRRPRTSRRRRLFIPRKLVLVSVNVMLENFPVMSQGSRVHWYEKSRCSRELRVPRTEGTVRS